MNQVSTDASNKKIIIIIIFNSYSRQSVNKLTHIGGKVLRNVIYKNYKKQKFRIIYLLNINCFISHKHSI